MMRVSYDTATRVGFGSRVVATTALFMIATSPQVILWAMRYADLLPYGIKLFTLAQLYLSLRFGVQGLQIIKDSGQPALFLPLGIALAFMAALASTMATPLGEPTMIFARGLFLYWHEAVQPWLVLAFIANMNWVLRRTVLSTLAKLAGSPI